MMAEVVVINRYGIRDTGAFEAAVIALAERVRTEGHRGVRSYHFFLTAPAEGRAVVVYDGPDAWVAHHDIIMGWPEMAALRAAADLREIDLHGPVTDGMRDWIDRMGLAEKVRHRGAALAGFIRTES
jgi:hypothetical protein